MHKSFKREIVLIISAIICLASVFFIPARAEDSSSSAVTSAKSTPSADTGKTVRVGCYNLGVFIHQNEDGSYAGYGADYLRRISEYTGWNFEITVTDNASLKSMLADGRIDFLMPVEFAKERLDYYTYTNYPIGEQINGLYVLNTRKDVYYDDFQKFSQMSIGAVDNTFPAASLRSYAQAHHFTTFTQILFPTLNDLHKGLESGIVDAACLSALGDIPDNYQLVAATNLMPFYVVTDAIHPSPFFDEFNNTINRINSEQPDFVSDLYNTYLSEQGVLRTIHFTREETEFIQKHPYFQVVSSGDRYPISYQDTQTHQMKGIFRDILELVSQKTGMKFTYATLPAGSPILKGLENPWIDLVVGTTQSPIYQTNSKIRLSKSLFNNLLGIVGWDGQSFESEKAYTIAIPENFLATNEHVKQYHPDYQILPCVTKEECMRMVRTGKADATIQNTDILTGILRHPEFKDLTLWHTFTGEGEYNFCAASRSDANPLLISILNKGISSLNKKDIDEIEIKYTSSTEAPMTFRDAISRYGLMMVGGGFAVLLFAILMISIF